MRLADIYVKLMLTVIAGLLAWIAATQAGGLTAVHAQSATEYTVEVVTADWSGQHVPALGAAINKVAAGRELISLIPHDQKGKYLAVFRKPAR